MAQRVERFIVAILDQVTNEAVGTGFVVTREGLIVTAYHVIVNVQNLADNSILSSKTCFRVRFPYAQIEKDCVFICKYSDSKADIAFLQVDKLPEQMDVPVLGPSIDCAGDKFVSMGYREVAGGAVGVIAPPEIEPIRAPYSHLVLKSDQIDRGMSGAPVLDLDQDRVVGMIVSTWYGDPNSGKDRETAFAAPIEALTERCSLLRLIQPTIGTAYNIIQPQENLLENLPSRRTNYFVGREEEKKSIINLLKSENPKVLISGAGGMGKTTLALESAYHFTRQKVFGVIVWVSTESIPELTLDILLNEIAETFHFEGFRSLHSQEKELRVRRLLRTVGTLLIIDGFEHVKDLNLLDFLRRLPKSCSLLLTSRHLSAVLQEEIMNLRELSFPEAEELMRKLSKGKRLQNASQEIFQEIYQVCEGMPLALEWAIGQINSGRQTLETVISRLVAVKIEAIYGNLFENSYKNLRDSEKHVLWAIAVSIGSASKKAIMYIAELSKESLENALEYLIEMNLIYENGEFEDEKVRFSVHPLLKNFIRLKLDQQSVNADKVVERYIRYFSDIIDRKEYDELDLNDIRVALDWYAKHDPKRLIEFVYALSYFFFLYGLWQERIERAYQALEISRELEDRKSESWILVNELGYMVMQQSFYSKAESYIKDGIEILKQEIERLEDMGKLEDDSKDQFGFQFMMGLALRYLGILNTKRARYTEAEKFFIDAFEIFQSLNRNSIIANQEIEMAELELKQENYILAENLFNKALDYHDKLKETKPWVLSWMARAYYGLGDIEVRKGRLTNARNLYEEAIKFAEGRNAMHEIAQTQYKLALLEANEGNSMIALNLSKKALKIFASLGNVELIDQLEEFILKLNPQILTLVS